MNAAFGVICLSLLNPAAGLASTLLYADNFNAPDSANFDNSVQTGRRSGLLGETVQIRSGRVQHSIAGNAVSFAKPSTGAGSLRFHDTTTVLHDFASGAAGGIITGEGGLRVEFDWIPLNSTDTNWVSFSLGFLGTVAGDPSNRVSSPETDFGILFRHNGGTQYFDNGVSAEGGSFTASATSHHVVIDYSFNSFADGADVAVTASVDGSAPLLNYNFQWANNSGSLYMDAGAWVAGSRIDGISITAVPEPTGTLLTGLAAGLLLRRRRRPN